MASLEEKHSASFPLTIDNIPVKMTEELRELYDSQGGTINGYKVDFHKFCEHMIKTLNSAWAMGQPTKTWVKDWKEDPTRVPMTWKQEEFIKTIDERLGIQFKGTSKQEACDYISEHVDAFHKAAWATNPTRKQKDLIKKIEVVLGKKFTGRNKKEAGEFIAANIAEYKSTRRFRHNLAAEMQSTRRDFFSAVNS